MSETTQPLPVRRPFLQTERKDTWWIAPLATAVSLIAFVIYAAWAGLQGNHYEWGPYISPFYSPLIKIHGWPFSPAILIMWAPAGFRLTCYYFRKAYYRALFISPPACAVGARPQNYKGERRLFLFQNLHRYFLYLALILLLLHIHDCFYAFSFADGFGVGVGSLVILLDFFFLSFFVFGCNSLRHLIGGGVDCYSCVKFGRQRYWGWRFVSFFNRNHREWAWISLFWVAFVDLYVRLVSMGVITDIRIF